MKNQALVVLVAGPVSRMIGKCLTTLESKSNGTISYTILNALQVFEAERPSGSDDQFMIPACTFFACRAVEMTKWLSQLKEHFAFWF